MKQKTIKAVRSVSSAAILAQTMSTTVSANRIQESDIGQGLLAMTNDLSGYMMIIGPVICLVAAMYFLSRKGMADEQDGKMWQKRIVIALICGVGVLLVSGIMKLITGYFV